MALGLKAREVGPPMSSRPGVRMVLVADLLLTLAAAAYAWTLARQSDWRIAIAIWGLLVVLSILGSLGLRPRAMAWRRRLGFLGILAVLWRGGPLEIPWLQVAVLAWTGLIWIVLLWENARVAKAVAEATGEETLE